MEETLTYDSDLGPFKSKAEAFPTTVYMNVKPTQWSS